MQNTTQGAAARQTTKPLPFYTCDGDATALFSVNAGVQLDVLLDHAQCFMLANQQSALSAAEASDHPAAWAAFYMAQTACALIEAMQGALAEEKRNV